MSSAELGVDRPCPALFSRSDASPVRGGFSCFALLTGAKRGGRALLVMSGETPVCKSCESANLEQQLSLIASPNKGGDAGAGSDADFGSGSTGMCCGGACGAFADA
jgi:hypothetical protein